MEVVLDLINILILIFNGLVIYWVFKRGKNKDFEKQLFDKKLEAYEEINVECSKLLKIINPESSPFVEIYNIKSKEKWDKYYEENIGKMVGTAIVYFEKVQAKKGLIISNEVLSKLYDFCNIITRFIVEASYYDTEILVDKYDWSTELLYDLRDEMKKDLSLKKLDSDLKNRLKSNFK